MTAPQQETHQVPGVGQLGDGLVALLLGPSHPGQGPAVSPAAEPRRQGPQTAVVAGPPRPLRPLALQLWNTAAGLVRGFALSVLLGSTWV